MVPHVLCTADDTPRGGRYLAVGTAVAEDDYLGEEHGAFGAAEEVRIAAGGVVGREGCRGGYYGGAGEWDGGGAEEGTEGAGGHLCAQLSSLFG